jgi:hypothetical protein
VLFCDRFFQFCRIFSRNFVELKKNRPMADQAVLTFNTLTEHDVYCPRLLSRRRKYLLNLRDGGDDLRGQLTVLNLSQPIHGE